MLCYPRRAASHAHAMRARCLPDSAAAAAAYAELGWRAFSLLAGLQQISRTCCERYRTTLQALPFSHTLILSCFGRQARVCISLVRECIRGAQGGLATCPSPSFLLPTRGAGDVFTWLRLPTRANTALSPAPAAD